MRGPEVITRALPFAGAGCRAATRPRGDVSPPQLGERRISGNCRCCHRQLCRPEFSGAVHRGVDSGAACRTKIESQGVAAFGRPLPRRRFAIEGDLLAAEPRLVADDRPGAALDSRQWHMEMRDGSPSIVR
jgi:hypothetical protein